MNHTSLRSTFVLVSAGILLLTAVPLAADWNSDLAVYLFAAGLEGQVGVGDVEGNVNMSFSDILSNLQMGGMAAYSGTNGRWAVQGDAVIANLGMTGRSEGDVLKVDVDVDLTVLEADAGYEVSDKFRVFAGARYTSVDPEVKLRIGDAEAQASGRESWVDPLVGVRWSTAGERWGFLARGDVGGFGVGSDFSWNAAAVVSYRISDSFSLGAGYRILDTDYESGDSENRFLWNTQMSGFVAGAIFSF